MPPIEEFLRTSPLFRDLPPRDLLPFSESACTRTYGRGELLPHSRRPRGILSLVERGSVRLYRLTAEGRQLTLGIRKAGDYFWPISTDATGAPRSCVEASACETVVHHFPRQRFDALAARHPTLALALTEQISRHLGEAYDRLEDAVLRPPDVQLAHTLVRLAAGGEPPAVAATHEEIATLLGTTRERVTKLLARLRAAGLVAYQQRRGRILLLQPRRLGDL